MKKVLSILDLIANIPEGLDSPLGKFLLALRNEFLGYTEPEFCNAVVSLTCENPLNPRTGHDLWQQIQSLWKTDPCILLAKHDVGHRLSELKALHQNIMPAGLKNFLDSLDKSSELQNSDADKIWQILMVILKPTANTAEAIWEDMKARWGAQDGTMDTASAIQAIAEHLPA